MNDGGGLFETIYLEFIQIDCVVLLHIIIPITTHNQLQTQEVEMILNVHRNLNITDARMWMLKIVISKSIDPYNRKHSCKQNEKWYCRSGVLF